MNRKITIAIISFCSILGFVLLVYYGLRHARGAPVTIEKAKRVVLKVTRLDKEIDLSKGISKDLWDSMDGQEIKLVYQLMVLPWGRSLVSPIFVKAFHNGRDIYFYIKWNDETENRIQEINKFSDATAILFPMKDDVQPPTIMMGFLGNANIWQWKGSQDLEYWLKKSAETKAYSDFYYPFEEEELFGVSKTEVISAVNDLSAIKVGTITPKPTQGNVQGRGFWTEGTWQVVFKRSFEAKDPDLDAIFKSGQKRLCAFAVWNGEKGDRGGRKSISEWVEVEAE